MAHGVLTDAVRPSNGNGGSLRGNRLPGSLGWRITKRNGRIEPFDSDKIRQALERCFASSCGLPRGQSETLVARVVTSVVNYLTVASQPQDPIGVEDVQRAVIAQLWALGQYDAAEHYTIYREERRRQRASRPISPEHAAAVREDAQRFPSPLQYYQFVSKFARYRDDEQRRETWTEAHARVFAFFRRQARIHLTDAEWAELEAAFFYLEATPAMRVLQMAGPALDRCHVGVYNCAYHPLKDFFAFAELLYILMQGTGAGFSVESEYISELPRIRKQRKVPVVHRYQILDTTEGWCDALHFGLQKWFGGEDVEFDDSAIRPAGARLRTKGGRASGREPLIALLRFTRNLILSKQGGYLDDIDVHDLGCMIGKIVQVGGVRRASSISLSDLDSLAMRNCKSGPWYQTAVYRTMANNSAVYESKPDAVTFMEEWLALAKSGSGERGIFNREAIIKHLPKRRKRKKFGENPCGEIILRPFQFCNLSIAIARPSDTPESLRRKVRAATIFGCMQKTCTNFRYIRPEWKQNCDEEALLGVDITGQADCPILQYGAPGREELLRELRQIVADTDAEYSARFGVNRSAADTCVKPGGDSAVLFASGSGISARYARYYMRWCRQSIHDPVSELMIDAGVPYAEAPEDKSLYVFGFPTKTPEGSTLRNDLTAIQQLENWLVWKHNWAEHSVSCTIYVEEHEWLAVGNWVYEHFDLVTGLTFMPKDNGTYRYAPHEEISREEYEKAVAAFPAIAWEKLPRFETEDMTTSAQTYACHGGACELT